MWYSSNLSRRHLPLICLCTSAPDGRTIFPNTLHLHLPARIYLSASLHSSSRCVALPQNLHHSAWLRAASGPGACDSALCWAERITSRLVLRVAIASASASSVAVIGSDCVG